MTDDDFSTALQAMESILATQVRKQGKQETTTMSHDDYAELERQISHLEKQMETIQQTPGRDIAMSGLGDDFDAHVQAEIKKGCPPSIAGQRVLERWGAHPPPLDDLRKQQASGEDFMSECDKVMIEKRLTSRQAAMQHVRRSKPDLFAKYQEV